MKSVKNHESIRLFENPILESLTHVHPAIPIILWGPVCLVFLYWAHFVRELSFLEWSSWMLIALFVWTATEYFLHRFVFHFPAKSVIGKRLIFLFHGIHHDDPNDPTRLVFPPFPAVIIMGLLYLIFSLIVPERYLEIYMAWFIIGYLAYDYIHYGTHHWPMKNPVARYLKKYHLRHHHAKEHSKYGVSNPLWDYLMFSVTGPKKEHK